MLLDTGHVHLPAVGGKVSWFGGPEDDVLAPDEPNWTETRHLLKLDPSDFYIAMRWDQHAPALLTQLQTVSERKYWWEQRRILVWNSDCSRCCCCWVADWGPNEKTGRAIDLSPGALGYLQMETDDIGYVEFAPDGIEPGPVDVETLK